MQPLLNLLKSGEYHISFHESKEVILFEDRYSDWKIHFSKTCSGFYDGYCLAFIATQTQDEINSERVKFFENEIKNGRRPAAIILNSVRTEHKSPYYILDGHHKLVAYHNLGISPTFIEITHFLYAQKVEFDLEKLIDVLTPWDIKHILKKWDEAEKYRLIQSMIDDPHSNIQPFVRRGYIKEYFDDGNLRHEAFYVDDKIDGIALDYWKNGILQQEKYYIRGMKSGIWKSYYPSGNIGTIWHYNSKGVLELETSYFESGAIQSILNKVSGSHKYWFENGQLSSEFWIKNGQYCDFYKHYYESGKIRGVTEYRVSEKSSNSIAYYENGNKEFERFSKNSQTIKDISYFQNGLMKTEIFYENCLEVKRIEYDEI